MSDEEKGMKWLQDKIQDSVCDAVEDAFEDLFFEIDICRRDRSASLVDTLNRWADHAYDLGREASTKAWLDGWPEHLSDELKDLMGQFLKHRGEKPMMWGRYREYGMWRTRKKRKLRLILRRGSFYVAWRVWRLRLVWRPDNEGSIVYER